MRVTERAAAWVAKRAASKSGKPSASATVSAPLKTSPAAVVSTAETRHAGTTAQVSAFFTSAPREPQVTITFFTPLFNSVSAAAAASVPFSTGRPVSRAHSDSVGRKEVDVFQVLFVDLRRRRRIENHPHAQFGGSLYRVFHGFERYFELDQQIAGLRQFGSDVVDILSGKPRICTGSHDDAVFGRIIDRYERHTRRGLRIADDMRSIHLFRGVAGHQFISEKVGPDTRHEKGVAAQPRDGDGLIGAFAAGNDPEFAAENGLAG